MTKKIKILIASSLIVIVLGVVMFCRKSVPHLLGQSSGVVSINSFSEFDFEKIQKGAIVIFDVDGVLINPASKIFWPKTERNHGEWIGKLYAQVFEKAKHEPLFYISKMLQKETPTVIEPIIKDIIRRLQNAGIMVIALTSSSTGSSFDISSMPVWRFNKLKDVGIDFSHVQIPNIYFNELPSQSPEQDGKYPVFYNGILFTSDSSKGAVIKSFLDRAHLKPSRVIFFDDRKSHLESVSQAIYELGIPFSGYQYLGESYMEGELDKAIARFQLNYVVDHEVWLNEDEARALLGSHYQAVEE